MNKYRVYEQYKSWDNSEFGGFDKNKGKNYQILLNDAGIDIEKQNIRNILDFGCGIGTLSGWLIANFNYLNITAIDNSKGVFEFFKKSQISQKISFKSSISEIEDDSIDLVFGIDVLEHLTYDEIRSFFKIVEKKLTKRGKMIFSFPNCMGIMGITNQFTDATHVSLITPPIIKFGILKSNLKLKKFEPLFNQKTNSKFRKILRKICSVILIAIGIRINLDYLATGNCFCLIEKK